MLEDEKAWLAGFIDGEGTITLWLRRNGRNLVPIVQIVNSNLQILEWVKSVLGFGSISRHVYETENWKGSHTLSIRAVDEVSVILVLVLPYLHLKKKHAELLSIYCNEHIRGSHRPTDIEMEIYYDLRELNGRGKI